MYFLPSDIINVAVLRTGTEFVEEYVAKSETVGLTEGSLPVHIML